jgi:hypothetical protein
MNLQYSSYKEYVSIEYFKKNCPDTKIWGPELWKIYHGIFQLPDIEKNKNIILDFIYNSLYILPCCFCQKQLIKYVNNNKLPDTLEELEIWLWNLHNSVNIMNDVEIVHFTDENKIKYKNINFKNSLNIYLNDLYLALDLNHIEYKKWYHFRNNIVPELEKILI